MKDQLAVETIARAQKDLVEVRRLVKQMQTVVGREPIHVDDDVSKIFLEIKKLVSATNDLDKLMKEFGA